MNPELRRFPFVPGALAASSTGVWELDVEHNTFRCCPVLSRMLGVPEQDGERGIPLQRFARVVHVQDRGRLSEQHGRLRHEGGPFSADYRLAPMPDMVRRVHARGQNDVDDDGTVRMASGVIIDVTDVQPRALPTAPDPLPGTRAAEDRAAPLDRLADHAIAARHAADDLGEEGRQMRPLIDLLLMILGHRSHAVRRHLGMGVEARKGIGAPDG